MMACVADENAAPNVLPVAQVKVKRPSKLKTLLLKVPLRKSKRPPAASAGSGVKLDVAVAPQTAPVKAEKPHRRRLLRKAAKAAKAAKATKVARADDAEPAPPLITVRMWFSRTLKYDIQCDLRAQPTVAWLMSEGIRRYSAEHCSGESEGVPHFHNLVSLSRGALLDYAEDLKVGAGRAPEGQK